MTTIFLKRKTIQLILSFSLIFSLFSFGFVPATTARAKEITIVGADHPVVTTSSGENVTDQDHLSRWQSYNVTYQWSIPNGQNIQSGDTAAFIIPDNIQVLYPTSFEVKDKSGDVIGTFSIKPEEKFGILTFNNYYSTHPEQNISGTLTFWGNGRSDTVYKDWTLNKVGWVNGENKPTWCIAYNPSGQTLHNVTIKDTLLGNQTLDIDSISIQYGYFDENNQFHSEGVLPNNEYQLETRNDGFNLTINELNKPIQITYTSTVPNSTNTIVNNIVQGSASEIGEITNSASISIGGNGSASGDRPTDSTTSSSTKPSDSTTSSSTKPSDSTTSSSTKPSDSTTSSSTKPSDSTTSSSTKPSDSTTSSSTKPSDSTTSSSTKPSDSTTSSSTKPSDSTTHDKNIIIIDRNNDKFQSNANTPVSQLPQTGMRKEFIFMCTGASLIIISIASGILIFKRKKKKHN